MTYYIIFRETNFIYFEMFFKKNRKLKRVDYKIFIWCFWNVLFATFLFHSRISMSYLSYEKMRADKIRSQNAIAKCAQLSLCLSESCVLVLGSFFVFFFKCFHPAPHHFEIPYWLPVLLSRSLTMMMMTQQMKTIQNTTKKKNLYHFLFSLFKKKLLQLWDLCAIKKIFSGF